MRFSGPQVSQATRPFPYHRSLTERLKLELLDTSGPVLHGSFGSYHIVQNEMALPRACLLLEQVP